MKVNIQDSVNTAVDTLTNSYSGKWEGVESTEQTSAFIQFMASNDLIFVVLGVSLIIWFVLLFYLIRVDRNVSKLEKSLKEESTDET
ncbi:MAG: hypothetical protein U5K72_16645 [Balneolaceae bacterium]|nr:hypothetical protein [Balneolaceae bacterium]